MLGQSGSTTSTGTYTIAYRVISADGHPVAGQVTFADGTVSTAATTSSRVRVRPATPS